MEYTGATKAPYNFIDLFAGAGGLSEGFIQAGFSPIAHVEMNPYAAQTLETRTGYYYLKEQGKLDIYFDYIKGKISRDKYLESIPEELLKSVCCETMSDETLPGLFDTIDDILTEKGIECAADSLLEFKETIDAFKIKNIHITSIVGDIWNTPEYMLSANANRQGIIFRQLI